MNLEREREEVKGKERTKVSGEMHWMQKSCFMCSRTWLRTHLPTLVCKASLWWNVHAHVHVCVCVGVCVRDAWWLRVASTKSWSHCVKRDALTNHSRRDDSANSWGHSSRTCTTQAARVHVGKHGPGFQKPQLWVLPVNSQKHRNAAADPGLCSRPVATVKQPSPGRRGSAAIS